VASEASFRAVMVCVTGIARFIGPPHNATLRRAAGTFHLTSNVLRRETGRDLHNCGGSALATDHVIQTCPETGMLRARRGRTLSC
jgi:hypothetical protein